jgi:F-type H+-transporting ATPase subunit b
LHSSRILFLTQSLPEGRVFALDTQTLIHIGIQILNGIVLAVILTLILYNPVKEFMQKRSEKIKSKIEDADATMAKANKLIAEYNNKMKNIESERINILEDARAKATNQMKAIIEDARQEASEIKKRSAESISSERMRLKEETRVHIIEVAALMAEKYIAQNIDSETQDKIFEETLAKMEDAQWRG